jgi:hypothetical protein
MAHSQTDRTAPTDRDREYFPIRLIPIVVPLSAVVLACGIYLLLGDLL